MTKHIFTLSIIAAVLFAGCSGSGSQKEQPPQPQQTTTSKETSTAGEERPLSKDTANAIPVTRLDYFTQLPQEVNGCGEYIAYDSIGLTKKQYIFVANNSGVGFIKINGKEMRLIKDRSRSITIKGSSYIAVYRNQDCKVVLRVRQSGINKSEPYKGTLQVTGNGIYRMLKIQGQVGC